MQQPVSNSIDSVQLVPIYKNRLKAGQAQYYSIKLGGGHVATCGQSICNVFFHSAPDIGTAGALVVVAVYGIPVTRISMAGR